MKIKIYQVVSAIIIGLMFIAGCQKQNSSPSNETSKPYEFVNGIVKFNSFNSYRTLLESEKQKETFLADVLKNATYTSYAESHINILPADNAARIPDPNEDVEDILSSPMLSGMVNDDGIVQIGNYLFKLDYDSSKVYVINIANQGNSYQKLLTKTGTGVDVFVFSTDDDILDILEQNNFPVNEAIDGEGLFNRCGNGAPERKDKGEESGHHTGCKPSDYRDIGRGDYKIVYQKAGFYFSLHLKSTYGYWCYNGGGSQSQNNAINGANSYIRYQNKCQNREVGPYTDDTEIVGSILSRRPYESGTGLKRFHYRVTFRYKGETEFGQLPGAYYYPRTYEVKYGY